MKIRQLLVLAVIACIAVGAVYAVTAVMPANYSAKLSGANEVPPVKTKATGLATFMVSPDNMSIRYKIAVTGMTDPTEAHVHMGMPGKNGAPVAGLYPVAGAPKPKGSMLAQGTIMAKDLIGPMKGKKIADLVKATKAGKTYANVHSKAHPDGEIRGQIMMAPAK